MPPVTELHIRSLERDSPAASWRPDYPFQHESEPRSGGKHYLLLKGSTSRLTGWN
jgi:hypothetical protein